MEKEYKISWLKVMVFLIILVLIIGSIVWFFTRKKDSNIKNYNEDMLALKDIGTDYFSIDKLPKEIGESAEINLDYLTKNKLLNNNLEKNLSSCDEKESYIRVTKTNDNEYLMRINLTCDKKSDYIIRTFEVDSTIEEENLLSDSNIKHVSSDSTNKYYSVVFDSNGGSAVAKQIIKLNDYARYVTSIKDGYTFKGWYLDKNLKIAYDFNTRVTKALVLYAKWEENR